MRAREFISEAHPGKISKRLQAATRGLNTFSDGEKWNTDYTLNRVMMAAACTDGTFVPDIDWKSWVGKAKSAHPYTKEEQEMLHGYNKRHDIADFTDSLIESEFLWDKKERYRLRSSDIFRELGRPNGITTTKISRSLTKRGLVSSKSNGEWYWDVPKIRNVSIWNYKAGKDKS